MKNQIVWVSWQFLSSKHFVASINRILKIKNSWENSVWNKSDFINRFVGASRPLILASGQNYAILFFLSKELKFLNILWLVPLFSSVCWSPPMQVQSPKWKCVQRVCQANIVATLNSSCIMGRYLRITMNKCYPRIYINVNASSHLLPEM